MIDIVKQFNEFANQNGFDFTYGTPEEVNATLNRKELDSTLVVLDVPIRRTKNKNEYGETVSVSFAGTLIFVRDGDSSNAIYNLASADKKTGEYYSTIVPMEADVETYEKTINVCNGFTVNEMSYIEGYHLNFDRVVNLLQVSFKVTYEY